MNEYSSTSNSSGLLKNYYDSGDSKRDSMLDALKKRRDGLTNKVLVPTKAKIEGTDIQDKQIEDQYS